MHPAANRLLGFSNHICRTTRSPIAGAAFTTSSKQRLAQFSSMPSSPSSSPSPSMVPPPSVSVSDSGPLNNVQANFDVSPMPKNPLGEGRYIRTAAALIIGDEILNGKTHDKNSNYFARYCFEQGIELKRIEVIADDEAEIIEASRRMVRNYDFVITSGGIGPTHDDITYASLAKAFDQPLAHHPECLRRMDEMIRHRPWVAIQNEEQREATRRMALFPSQAEVLFIARDVWVPVVRLEGKLCIFPGIPALFQKMINGLTPFLPLPPLSEKPLRMQIFTSRPESLIAPYLTALQARMKAYGIQVGSYPVLAQGVYVSLIGRDRDKVQDVAKEVETEVVGKIVTEEEVKRRKDDSKQQAKI
ncbi:Molybdopterin binding protein [Pleurotus eryngii]|uniref:Molybdopterin binding protein n=1 Tax=Pleurotus eryngii TaxID=5323 RepID=A0A9P6DAB5_PLEER|nr:Molybdopterin binding protein [Pleurotus eryngii]